MAGSEDPPARACENPELRAFLVAIQPGQIISGTVSGVHNFGVFVRLAPGIEGLLHVSEMADSPVESPDQLASEDDQITVRVAEVDLQRHRVRFCAHDS